MASEGSRSSFRWLVSGEERNARAMRRGDAWRLVNSVMKPRRVRELRFEVWCMPLPSLTNPEGGEFVVDYGASMHMLSQRT